MQIVTHYPTTWLKNDHIGGAFWPDILKNPNVHILYFGAHVHSTDNTTNVDPELRRPGWHDFCIGGGGGWACDGVQGFVVGEVKEDGRVANLRMHHASVAECCTSPIG